MSLTKLACYTLGCRANQYQTTALQSKFKAERVKFGEPADIYLINTCTVTNDADRKSRQAIRRALKLAKKVIVTGCYAKLEGKKLKQLFPEIILSPTPASRPRPTPKFNFIPPPLIRANLMIEDGCENFCSYCIVPYARGKVKSRALEEIIFEANQLVNAGAREIVLTGINLAAYGKDVSLSLFDVINKLEKIDRLFRIRLSSIEPMYLDKKLIDAIATTPKVCKHLHIPLQSGDNNILKKMHRNYSPEDYLKIINRIKKEIPNCGITTDVMVGFPGEGKKEFQNTINLIDKIKFSRLHIFSYSKRKGTPAASLPDQIDPKTKKERNKILQKLNQSLMLEFASQYTEKEIEILVEQKGKGLTSNYIRVHYSGKEEEVGSLKKIVIKEIKKDFCLGFEI